MSVDLYLDKAVFDSEEGRIIHSQNSKGTKASLENEEKLTIKINGCQGVNIEIYNSNNVYINAHNCSTIRSEYDSDCQGLVTYPVHEEVRDFSDIRNHFPLIGEKHAMKTDFFEKFK